MPEETSLKKLVIHAITHRSNPVSQGQIDTFWTRMVF